MKGDVGERLTLLVNYYYYLLWAVGPQSFQTLRRGIKERGFSYTLGIIVSLELEPSGCWCGLIDE